VAKTRTLAEADTTGYLPARTAQASRDAFISLSRSIEESSNKVTNCLNVRELGALAFYTSVMPY
jgi:hypothetical protein